MMTANPNFTMFAALAACALVWTAQPNEARACDPAAEQIAWSVPENGDAVSPQVEILVGTLGAHWGERQVALVEDGGDQVAVNVESYALIRSFRSSYAVIPEEPLAPGDYTLSVSYPDNSEFDDELSFSVEDVEPDDFEAGPADVRWYRETSDEPTGDSCYYAQEMNFVAVGRGDDTAVAYEISLTREDAEPLRHLLHPDEADGELQRYEVENVDCIAVAAVGPNGSRGVERELCSPDKCAHLEGATGFGDTDWDGIDGCESRESGGDDAEPGGGGSDAGVGGGLEDGSRGGCTVGSNSASSALGAWLVGLALFALFCRTRRPAKAAAAQGRPELA